MRIQIRPTLVFGSKNAKDRAIVDLVWLTTLLKDIDHGKTLMSACKKMGLSYRNVWQKLNDVEQALGFKLMDRVRGHGSQLSEYARYLIQFTEDFDQKTVRLGQASLSHLEEGFAQFRVKAKKHWRFASSSDPIIQKAVFDIGGFELITAGSGEALERLLNYEVDIAGFHVSDPESSQIISRRLDKDGMEIFPVMKRVQGLLVAKGNPLNIISPKDLLKPKIRFINRQKGSGTRLLLDTILAKEGVDGHRIRGYENEEFLSIFNNKLFILNGGIESGFVHVEKITDYPGVLFHVRRNDQIYRISEVPFKASSLKSTLNSRTPFSILVYQVPFNVIPNLVAVTV